MLSYKIKNEIDAAVSRGEAWLDTQELDKPDWADKVELGYLNMCDWGSCVYGQTILEGATRDWDIDDDFFIAHGFNLPLALMDYDEAWNYLQTAWLNIIAERQDK